MTAPSEVDVAVVGAGIAGCTAATLFAQHGLGVALIEQHRHIETPKPLCTHLVQASAAPVLRQLGLEDAVSAAGAVPIRGLALWSRAGWIQFPLRRSALHDHGWNLRRNKLDPLLRRHAAATPGVTLMLGQRVSGLLQERGQIQGVIVDDGQGQLRNLAARLVVGADGRYARVAALAGMTATTLPNGRFCLYRYYRGLPRSADGRMRMWLWNRDVVLAVPTDDDLMVMAAFPHLSRLAEFQDRREECYLECFTALPGCPDPSVGEAATPLRGYTRLPNTRRAATRPGLALIGDAALALDPVFAAGCGWAFRSAGWLVDATAQALRHDTDLTAPLQQYARQHERELGGIPYQLATSLSAGRALTRLDRAGLWTAARLSALLGRSSPRLRP